MNAFKWIGAIAVLSLCAPALGQVKKTGDTYLLRMKMTKGQKISYTATTTISQGGMQPIVMPMTTTVTDVKGDVYTVKYSMGSVMGQPGQDVVVKMNSQGKILEGKAGGQMVAGLGTTQFPTKAIKVGESWTSTTDQPSPAGTMKVVTTYTFKGLKTVSGKSVAEVSMKVSSTGAGGVKVSGTGTMTLLASDGTLFGTNMNMTTSMSAGGSKPMTYDMKVVVARK